MGLTIYLNGEYVAEENAKVSVFDHGLLYGDGIFEGIRAYHNRVFRLDEHIDRLYENANSIMLDIWLTKEEMKEVVIETFRKNNLREGYVRLVVTRGVGDLGLDPAKCDKATIFCIASNITLYPESFYTDGLVINTVATRRNLNESVSARFKSLNYLNNILAKIESKLTGTIEALMLNNEGYVTEATGDNIFIIKNGVLTTPPTYAGILEGVTRNAVMELARERGIEVREELFTRHDVYRADECVLTGTAAEVIPIIQVDGRHIGEGKPGTITWQLIHAFKELTKIDGPSIFKN